MFDWLLDRCCIGGRRRRPSELAERLGVSLDDLKNVPVRYDEFSIAKRSGGSRRIAAPCRELKQMQRRILRRLLRRLKAHPAAIGFERGESFVTNARRHEGRTLIVRFDLRDFFPSIPARRVHRYFRAIGWDRRSSRLLTRLCTHNGSLPQGAPTSPRLSNLVNYRLDARLSGLAKSYGALYTRYADDLTFSFREDPGKDIVGFMRLVRRIVAGEGYQVHRRKKWDIRRRHQRQEVTGLVVNHRANLPRLTRRWLRAVKHRWELRDQLKGQSITSGWKPTKRPTITREQLQGWQALEHMIAQRPDDEAAL